MLALFFFFGAIFGMTITACAVASSRKSYEEEVRKEIMEQLKKNE